MKTALMSYGLAAVGAACTVALMFRATAGQANFGFIAISIAIVSFYTLCAGAAYSARNDGPASVFALIGNAVSTLVGVGLPARILFFAPVDAQAGMGLMLTPIYQTMCATPFLFGAVWCLSRRRGSGNQVDGVATK